MYAPAHRFGALERLFIGLLKEQRRKRLIVALQAYIDESGTDEKSQIFVFAGYVGTIKQLDKFSEGWAGILAAPPKIR